MSNHDIEQQVAEHAPTLSAEQPPSSRLPDEPFDRPPAATQRDGALTVGVVLLLVGLAWMLLTIARVVPLASVGESTLADRMIAGNLIEIDAGSADVSIVRWDQPEFRVTAYQRGWSTGDAAISIRSDGDTIRVSHRANCFLFCGSLRYQIAAPAAGSAHITSLSGDIRAVSIDGGLTARTTSGDVRLKDTGGLLSVETVSGDVSMRSGRVAEAHVATTSGAIELHGVYGMLVAKSTSGDIVVQQAAGGPITLATVSGTIDYDGDLRGSLSASTISGDIRLQLPEYPGLRVHASTVSGTIETPAGRDGAIRNEWRATIGDGTNDLSVTTTSGDITIELR